MLEIEQQLHGYQQGHQLLASTAKLSRRDQDLVDRLSDIAGPLRPGEQFNPYLTCYPLPSALYYVIARTWQDLSASRAGCVRTRSALIPMQDWLRDTDALGVIDVLTQLGPELPVEQTCGGSAPSVPAIPVQEVTELTEALFLESRVPIVVFDSTAPEEIAIRLLAGTWPSFRRAFSISTFALSPRMLEGKSFDLVFAPINAKGRFSDWVGRRIDARTHTEPKHRWSIPIASNLFAGDGRPLTGGDALGELSTDLDADESVLRLSLLWNELHGKLATNPNAALGLLDIAHSRPKRDLELIRRMAPELGLATKRAIAEFPPKEAWRFLTAFAEKVSSFGESLLQSDIKLAASRLAEDSPEAALEATSLIVDSVASQSLLGACAEGLARRFTDDMACAMSRLDERVLLALLLSNEELATKAVKSPDLIEALIRSIAAASIAEVRSCINLLLPLLTNEQQFPVAAVLISELSPSDLLQEVRLLSEVNGLASKPFNRSVLKRALEVNATKSLRDLLVALPATPGADDLLIDLLAPTPEEVAWIRHTTQETPSRRYSLTLEILRRASSSQFDRIIDSSEWEHTLPLLVRHSADARDILRTALLRPWPNSSEKVETIAQLLPSATRAADHETLIDWVQILLDSPPSPTREETIVRVLQKSGGDIDIAWLIQTALSRRIAPPAFDANLSMISGSKKFQPDAIAHIDLISRAIVSRGVVDFQETTAKSVATLLWECTKKRPIDVEAFARLMRFVIWQRGAAASPLITSVFPAVYLSLDDVNEGTDPFGFFRMFDWDKKRSLRNELVDAFVRSKWRPTDIALAAARGKDALRVLERLGEQKHGGRYLAEIKGELAQIPEPWRKEVSKSLKKLDI